MNKISLFRTSHAKAFLVLAVIVAAGIGGYDALKGGTEARQEQEAPTDNRTEISKEAAEGAGNGVERRYTRYSDADGTHYP